MGSPDGTGLARRLQLLGGDMVAALHNKSLLPNHNQAELSDALTSKAPKGTERAVTQLCIDR